MPYNPYQVYQPMYQGFPDMRQFQPQMQPAQMQSQQQSGSGITWVQGEEGAKAYMVAPGNSVLLMDSENSAFYVKSTDQSGMPMPLRIFDYQERTSAKQPAQAIQNQEDSYVTRKEFDALAARLDELTQTRKQTKKEEVSNA